MYYSTRKTRVFIVLEMLVVLAVTEIMIARYISLLHRTLYIHSLSMSVSFFYLEKRLQSLPAIVIVNYVRQVSKLHATERDISPSYEPR